MGQLGAGDEEALRRALSHAVAYRNGMDGRPIPARIDAAEAMRRFGGPLNEEPRPPAEVIDRMAIDAADGLTLCPSPGFHGFVIGGSHPAGVAADMLVSAWGQNAAYAALAPSVAAMESAVCRWAIEMMGLPPESGAGITTGATLGTMIGLMAARHSLLGRAGWDVEARGLFGAPEVQVVIGDEAHSAIPASLRYIGFGAERVHKAPVDDQGRILHDDFARILDRLSGPILVILQAGHINSGAFDPFARLIPLARAKGAWVHVDGAFGLWVRAVPALAHRLEGVDGADSWAVDLHKWLNAPYDAALVIVRDRAALVGAMSAHAGYLPDRSAIWDPADSVPELSRRARGVPSYAILRTLGASGVREMVARHCQLAERVSAGLAAITDVTVMNEPASNQISFRVGNGEAGDAWTGRVLAQVQAEGRNFPSHGVWKGRQIIRVSLSNHATTGADIDALLASVATAVRDCAPEAVPA